MSVTRHSKLGSPDSICVMYRCGIRTFREWICLDHPGYAGAKAHRWWATRFGERSAEKATVDTALADMCLNYAIKAVTRKITVVKRGKYFEIINYSLNKETHVIHDS